MSTATNTQSLTQYKYKSCYWRLRESRPGTASRSSGGKHGKSSADLAHINVEADFAARKESKK